MASGPFLRASALCYRLFDIGGCAGALEQARKLLTAGQRLTLQREAAASMISCRTCRPWAIGTRPLVLRAGRHLGRRLGARLRPRRAERHRAAAALTSPPEQLIPRRRQSSYDGPAIDAPGAQDQVRELRATLEAVHRSCRTRGRSYTVLSVPALGDAGPRPPGLLDDPALPRLLPKGPTSATCRPSAPTCSATTRYGEAT